MWRSSFFISLAVVSLFFALPQDAAAQRRCSAGQIYSNACQTCVADPIPTGACPAPSGGQSNSCGQCVCPSGQIDCSGTCQASQQGNACTTTDGRPGTFNACGTSCAATERPPVRLSPYSVTADDQARASIWINKTAAGNLVQLQDNGGDRFVVERDGDLRITGAATGGDIYLNDGKAVRIDATGASALNLGNYDSGAGAFHFTLRAGTDSLADLILRKGDSDRWALAVESGAAANDFEIRRFRTGAWSTLFSLDYDTGNITLLDGATIGGVDLADVITQPATCGADQVLQWSGTVWTCAAQAGGAVYTSGDPNVIIGADNTISLDATPNFNSLTVAGITTSGTFVGNFTDSNGRECAGNQILQRSADGATWTCAALPAAGITAEVDPTFAVWRGVDVGVRRLSDLTVNGEVFSGSLRVGGAGILGGNLNVGGDGTVSGNLTVSGNSTVNGSGTFGGAVTINNNDLTITRGDINLDANREIQLAAPTVGADNRLNIDGATGAGGGVALRIISPGTENISEVLLRQGDTDRWALSARGNSVPASESNFEIWRNNGGWTQALEISYADGVVRVPGTLTTNQLRLTGGLTVPGNLSVTGGGDSTFAGSLGIGNRDLNLDNTDSNDSVIFGQAHHGRMNSGDYLLRLITWESGSDPIPEESFRVDRDGNVRALGDITADGRIVGATAEISGNSTMDRAVVNTTLNVTGNTFVSGTLSAQGPAIVSGTLTANAAANVTGALDVGGTITAGSQNVQITSPGGGLKMADLANEDWDAATSGARGWLMIYKRTSACDTVCNNHGLTCRLAFGFEEVTIGGGGNYYAWDANDTSCTSSTTRVCMCGG